MNLEIERAVYARWFDGLAVKEIASPYLIGRLAYEERARIAEKREAELVAALRSALKTAEFERHADRSWHLEARRLLAEQEVT